MKTDNPIVGINFSRIDKTVCEYVDFLSTKIPISTVNNLFVFTARGSFNALQKDTNYKEGELFLKTLKNEMSNKLSGFYKNNIKIKNHAVAGLFVESIYHEFNKTNTDMIFVGKETKAHGMNSKFLIRTIPASTFIVPQKAKHKLGHVLIVLDNTGHSKHLLQKALDFCQKVNPVPKITCLHVVHWAHLAVLDNSIINDYQFYSGTDMNMLIQSQLKREEEDFKVFVKENAKDFENLDIKVKIIEEKGKNAYAAAKDYLDHHRLDLAILGTKSHSGFDAHLMGSFAEGLITVNDKTPLLVIR